MGLALSAVRGQPLGTIATFTDPNPGVTSSDFTATIDWGDGTTSTGTVAYDAQQNLFTVSGGSDHSYYSAVGTFTITVTVTDTAGNWGTGQSTAAISAVALEPDPGQSHADAVGHRRHPGQ